MVSASQQDYAARVRAILAAIAIVLALALAGCGAALRHDTGPSPQQARLVIKQYRQYQRHERQLRSSRQARVAHLRDVSG